MEFLKKTICIFAMGISMHLSLNAQTHEQLLTAFKKSYTNETKGDISAATNDLQIVYQAESYELNLRMGWLNYLAKKYDASMTYYQKAIDLKKFSVEARLGYITSANAAKKYDKSYQKYEEILKIDPYNATANYWVGVTYYTLKKYDVAVKYFELVVNMHPFDYDANHMLAWSYLYLGKTGDAKILFEKALLIKPYDESAAAGLSKCK